ncbi:multidrug transporter [Leifsonia sp. NPDC080035]|uniref:Multidrug transporter n=1 Tax=Leifsonia sp. NPDC080035 TaxID=3143936 RepID=A0AAU7G770_9MICO
MTGKRDDRDDRADQLTTAPKATEKDAAPRIETSEGDDGRTRIDIRDDAEVRPGADPADR